MFDKWLTDRTLSGPDTRNPVPEAVAEVPTEEVAKAAPEAKPLTEEKQELAAKPDGDASDQRPRKGVGKRIDELTAARRQAERDRDFWRDRAIATERSGKPAEQTQAKSDQEPTLEQFNFDQAAYMKARIDWGIEQGLTAKEAKKATEAARAREQKAESSFKERQDAAIEKYDDYEEKVFGLELTPTMERTIVEMDQGAEVAYHLGNNPEKAQEIAQMSENGQVRALARIEVELSKKAPEAAPAVPKLTKAPPPPSSVSTKTPVAKNPEDMSPDEWRAWRTAQLRKR